MRRTLLFRGLGPALVDARVDGVQDPVAVATDGLRPKMARSASLRV
jgi:hypothetical protein